MRNLIKYTLGLPYLFLISFGGILIMGLGYLAGLNEIETLCSFLYEMWKPYEDFPPRKDR
jgi:hypothetical protein